MKSIEHDIEEYHDNHCSKSDNGFDNPESDTRDYEWSGEQMGVLTMPFDGRK